LVKAANRWTVPVSTKEVEAARHGQFAVYLTPSKPVPSDWFPPLRGCRILGLASGGGQQGPLLAAAGADVTVFDNSPLQLGQDREVARRDHLKLGTVEGDMRDLSAFADASFDLIFHPCSNCFVPDILPVWRECWRVLRPGGLLLSGFVNPIAFCTDRALETQGILQLRYAIPYSDLEHRGDPQIRAGLEAGDPISFGHTLQAQIGGQLDAGFLLSRLFEDGWSDASLPIDRLMKCFIATRAIKP
jgi:SAM-dependent methyltransferase